MESLKAATSYYRVVVTRTGETHILIPAGDDVITFALPTEVEVLRLVKLLAEASAEIAKRQGVSTRRSEKTVDWRIDQGDTVPVDELRARFIELGDERDNLAAECAVQASELEALVEERDTLLKLMSMNAQMFERTTRVLRQQNMSLHDQIATLTADNASPANKMDPPS